ncbi:trypsin-like peptidase domain-containing protein [Fischerella sp. PCC 9605]|uniref:trypsin-like peptidase domain-containing protein n=1 Tax=Fischerella sp. PCC 9605 TaxID=1173024 RepID=UPI00047C067A|nr:trypsin-like peptidase domain-containing protein [Fischerella sp. PCC 9605]
MNKIINHLQTTERICQVVNNKMICQVITGNIPHVGTVLDFPTEETRIDDEKIAEIIKLRKPGTKPFRYLSVGDPNYLPFSFLERGLRCGAAVCLLRRPYSPQDLMDIIRDYTTDEFPAILDILSQELAIEPEFWQRFTKVSEALEDENFNNCMTQNRDKRILVPIATGFLVGRNYLLTNHHVLPSIEEAEDFIAQFRYETDELERDNNCANYRFDTSFFKTNDKLDYTLVKLHSLSEEERLKNRLSFLEAGDNFGWLSMQKEDRLISPTLTIDDAKRIQEKLPEAWKNIPEDLQNKATISGLPGEPVNIIQHPRGRYKEIILSDNRVQVIYENFLEYAADADFGSSGSPVFNVQWQLVGLHHAALVESNNEANDNSSETQIKVRGNVGIRIHQIVKDLEGQEGTEDFLNEFVYNQGRTKRKVYILAGRKREDVFEREEDAEIDAQITKALGQEIVNILKTSFPSNFNPQLVPEENLSSQEDAIAWINQRTEQDYKVGDVALEILTNYASQPPQKSPYSKTFEVRGATVYYIQFKSERKAHAEMLLNSLVKKVPELPNRGAQPDTAVIVQGLDFCRDIKMPSLDLFVGYLNNSKDLELLKNRTNDIASGIANGLVEWSNYLCPQPQQQALLASQKKYVSSVPEIKNDK